MFGAKIKAVLSTHKAQLVVASLISATAGGIVGTVITKRVLNESYSELLATEIDEAKRFYDGLHKRGVFETPESTVAAAEAVRALADYQGLEPDEEDDEEETHVVPVEVTEAIPDEIEEENIFDSQTTSTFNYEVELAKRTPGQPYVITDAEYFQNESGYEQVTLTYYAGDNVLADDRDQMVENVSRVVGDENLNRFGHGSNDSRVVYVRNDKMNVDYEILLHDGDYAVVVHGYMPDEPRRKPRRMRDDRE